MTKRCFLLLESELSYIRLKMKLRLSGLVGVQSRLRWECPVFIISSNVYKMVDRCF
jgi:hypothetical protein